MNNIPRPEDFKTFVGQERVKHEISVAVSAAKGRGDAPEHMLLYGPPGLGKTTLAGIVAAESEMPIIHISAPAITRPGDLVSILTNLQEPSVVFIDEIHALERQTEELLHTALEDQRIDILVGEGTTARSISLHLTPFTLVGATTRSGDISGPLRDRFGIITRLDPYTDEDISQIVLQSSEALGTIVTREAAQEIARRSQGTPRIANRWLRRVRDWAQVHGTGIIDHPAAVRALESFGIDEKGLDPLARDLLQTLAAQYQGGPAGIGAIAAAIGEDEQTILNVCEPHLLRSGLIVRTSRGRKLTEAGWEHLKKE